LPRPTASTLFLLLLSLILSGCARQSPDKTITPGEAHQKLVRLCRDEYNLDIVTKEFEHTVWIYLALNKPFTRYIGTKAGPAKSPEARDKWGIKYIDGKFEDGTFRVAYDIRKDPSYQNDRGIGAANTDEFTATQGHLLSAIHHAYADVEKLPDSDRYAEVIPGNARVPGPKEDTARQRLARPDVREETTPDFFVVVIADIVNGIETRMYLHLQDLRRAFVDQGFGEEYVRRVVTDQLGDDRIIGDTGGDHLDAHDLTWPDFLAKQIVYRATLKYTYSALPPLEDPQKQLALIAAETIQAYGFNDFDSVALTDLGANTTAILSRAELRDMAAAPPRLPGTIHKIKFNFGEPTSTPGVD